MQLRPRPRLNFHHRRSRAKLQRHIEGERLADVDLLRGNPGLRETRRADREVVSAWRDVDKRVASDLVCLAGLRGVRGGVGELDFRVHHGCAGWVKNDANNSTSGSLAQGRHRADDQQCARAHDREAKGKETANTDPVAARIHNPSSPDSGDTLVSIRKTQHSVQGSSWPDTTVRNCISA